MHDLESQVTKAAFSKDATDMQALLATGLDVNYKTPGGMPLIVLATQFRNTAVIELLLNSGARVNEPAAAGNTALMDAADKGDVAVINLLLDHGADIGARGPSDLTAYDSAEFRGRKDVMTLLWSKGARPGQPRTVLVLGAGFTKGFFPNAPVLIDSYGVCDNLLPKYEQFPAAKRILNAELKQSSIDGFTKNKINIERLMTRLAAGMPYDSLQEDTPVLRALLADVKRAFVNAIAGLRDTSHATGMHKVEDFNDGFDRLTELAKYMLDHCVDVITFNYDDLLDQSLEAACSEGKRLHAWHPEPGYGFYCRPSPNIIGMKTNDEIRDPTAVLLLKIHGSMNWRIRRGATEPYGLGDFYHREHWSSTSKTFDANVYDVSLRTNQHLEPYPFIVPPILTKSDLVNQPLLRMLWTESFNVLKLAHQIIFVGYSFPVTDIASTHLFVEALFDHVNSLPKITVVDFTTDTSRQAEIMKSYRRVFSDIADRDFHFDGAQEWAKRFVEQDQASQIVW